MIQIATTTNQSERLLACGVDPDSADFAWLYDKPNEPRLTMRAGLLSDRYVLVNAWSLSALLAMLPTTLVIGKFTWWLDIAPMDCGKLWSIGYYNADNPLTIKGLTHRNDLMECAVEEIEWLTTNGYKLNEI